MARHLFFLLAAVLFVVHLPAQNESPMVVISAKGKVEYLSSDKSIRMKVGPGAVLQKSGSFKMAGGSTALVYCGGQFKNLQGPGTKSPSNLFVDMGSTRSYNFDGNFGMAIEEAVGLIAYKSGAGDWSNVKMPGNGWGDEKRASSGWGDEKRASSGWGDEKRASSGWGDEKRASSGWGDEKRASSGWGGQGSNIYSVLPGGNVRPGIVVFSWSKPNNTAPYQLDILDEANKVLHTVTAADTFAAVDLGKLNLTPDQPYFWKVSVPTNADLRGEKSGFTVSTEEEFSQTARQVGTSKIYKSASPAVQRLMEAAALEKGGWYYDAERYYADLLKKYPQDNLVRMMYAAFWMRGGLEIKAKAVANK